MILSCPSCSTRYLVDPRALGSVGRRVRCAKCLYTWLQAPPADMPKSLEPPLVEPRPIPPGSNLPALAGRAPRRGVALGWVALVAVVVAVIGGGAYFRNEIVAAWPATARLYAAIGQKPELPGAGREFPGAGLELRNVSLTRSGDEGSPVFVIVGEVANVTDQVRDVPLLRGALVGSDERELQYWTFSAARSRLLPGEVIDFRTELANPAPEAVGLSVTFTQGPQVAPEGPEGRG